VLSDGYQEVDTWGSSLLALSHPQSPDRTQYAVVPVYPCRRSYGEDSWDSVTDFYEVGADPSHPCIPSDDPVLEIQQVCFANQSEHHAGDCMAISPDDSQIAACFDA